MSWNLEGMAVEGLYLSGDVKVKGVVTLSRVKYGGQVTHHVKLDEGFAWKGSTGKVLVSRVAGETVIVDHKNITRVKDAV